MDAQTLIGMYYFKILTTFSGHVVSVGSSFKHQSITNQFYYAAPIASAPTSILLRKLDANYYQPPIGGDPFLTCPS